MGCFNDPVRNVCGLWWGGWVADTNYLYPARWGSINYELLAVFFCMRPTTMYSLEVVSLKLSLK